jgi:amidophosphoribosyltransferase
MPSPHELVAHGRTTEEISEHIGADLVIYQTLEDLITSCNQWNPAIKEFDCSVFTGKYVSGGVDERYLERLQKVRNDNAKAKRGESVKEELELAEGCSGPMSECHILPACTSVSVLALVLRARKGTRVLMN